MGSGTAPSPRGPLIDDVVLTLALAGCGSRVSAAAKPAVDGSRWVTVDVGGVPDPTQRLAGLPGVVSRAIASAVLSLPPRRAPLFG